MAKYILIVCLFINGCFSNEISQLPASKADKYKFPETYVVKYIISTSLKDVAEHAIYQLEQSESLFYPLKVDFQLFRIVNPDDPQTCHFHPTDDVLTIHIYPMWSAGRAQFPEAGPPVIWLNICQDPSTFAHEIGHSVFNLYHPWGEDYVQDTPTQSAWNKENTNIMDYSDWPWWLQTLTPGQIERAKVWANVPPRNRMFQ